LSSTWWNSAQGEWEREEEERVTRGKKGMGFKVYRIGALLLYYGAARGHLDIIKYLVEQCSGEERVTRGGKGMREG
jgi:hypothetical protein